MTPDPRSKPLPPEWGEVIDAFCLELRSAGRTAQTIRLRRAHLAILARWAAPRGPWDLTHVDLVTWSAGQDWSPATRRSVRSSLVAFYSWALDLELTTTNPTARLPRARMTPPAPHPAPDDAYTTALAGADEDEHLMLRLAAEMGLRRGEIARVHSEDVLHGPWGLALRIRGKGGRQRLVPLTDGIADLLRAREPGWAFPGGEDGHVSANWVGVRLSRLLPEGWTAHSLRHRFATRAYGVGHDLLVVQQLLGHSSVATTQVYVRVQPDALRSTVLAAL